MIPLLRAIAGLIVWAMAFSSLYAMQGYLCADEAIGAGTARRLLCALFAGWLALHLWLCWRLWPMHRSPALIDRLAFGLAVVGLISTAYTGFPVALTTTCA